MPDYSPKFTDLWWKNSFYLTMIFTGFFGSCCCMYYFSMKKLTLKYLLMRFCGWDEPKDTGNWLFCLNKSAAQIEKEKIARERLDAASYIPLDQDVLEAGRSAVLDGTVQKKKRVPNTQNKRLQQQQNASPSFTDDGNGAIELALAIRTDDRGNADKIRFEHKAGTSETVYRGGRMKQRTHMIMHNLDIVENFKKTANATIPNSVLGEGEGEAEGEAGEGQIAAHGEQGQGQEGSSSVAAASAEDGNFNHDQDSAELSGQGYSPAATTTLTSVMRTLFSSSPRSTAKVAPVAAPASASVGDTPTFITGTASASAPAPVGRRSSLTTQLKGAARKVVQHRAVESNPLDDEW